MLFYLKTNRPTSHENGDYSNKQQSNILQNKKGENDKAYSVNSAINVAIIATKNVDGVMDVAELIIAG
jgi:hypothetical protein